MTAPIQTITVYCSSSDSIDGVYARAAEELGQALAKAGVMLVYGGGCVGLMGRVAETVHRHGGRVHGVITERLVALEQARHECDELEVTPTMRDRKARMEELADAFIALPGGLGTFEELFEMMVAKVLGEHAKPIVLVNVAGYYDPFLELLERSVEARFMRPGVLQLIHLVDDPSSAVEIIMNGAAAGRPDDSDLIPCRGGAPTRHGA
ncbi:MAG: TIGR00730 family Rossman fold protein [Phycisphaerales bacterium]